MSQSDWPEEGRRPDQPDRTGRRPPDDWDQPPAPPSGMSGGMKACIVIIIVVGLCCLLCCGIFGWLGYSMVPKMSENPADVDATRDSIAKIDLLPGLKPKMSMRFDNFFMSMPMVVYENPGHATLMLMQMHVKMKTAGDFNQVMRQQFEQRRSVEVGHMEKSKTETRTLKIKGKECPFVFTTGEVQSKAGGKKTVHHEIEGTFEGKDGQAVIVINFDDTYKEDDVIKMLESIQ